MKEITKEICKTECVTMYVANDGQEFSNCEECRYHERDAYIQEALRTVKNCKDLQGCCNFSWYCEFCEDYDYLWFLPQSVEDCDLLRKAFGDDFDFNKNINKWICVEHSNYSEPWITTLEDGLQRVSQILEKLGYDMKVYLAEKEYVANDGQEFSSREEYMKKYNVHFSGHYGYDVVVEARDEKEAKELAESYEPAEDEYYYEPEDNYTEVWEVD